jgi:hypothetical protein
VAGRPDGASGAPAACPSLDRNHAELLRLHDEVVVRDGSAGDRWDRRAGVGVMTHDPDPGPALARRCYEQLASVVQLTACVLSLSYIFPAPSEIRSNRLSPGIAITTYL